MHHLHQFFSPSNRRKAMNPRKNPGKPRLGRVNAAKNINYEAPSSSFDSSEWPPSLYTRSMDPSSFRVIGLDGEVDCICRSLGLTGPDDFAIPREAWEARTKVPSSRLQHPMDTQKSKEVNEENEHELCFMVKDSVRISSVEHSKPKTELLELNECRLAATGCSPRSGINGARPPLLKPPPFMRLPDVDNTCSNWDLLKTFAPLVEDQNQDEPLVGGRGRGNLRKSSGRIRSWDSFSTSNDDDSSSTTTDPANISPNLRCKPIITSWVGGKRLGSGSFGSVYEAISQYLMFLLNPT